MNDTPKPREVNKNWISTVWPIMASCLAAAAFIMQMSMNYSGNAASQESEIKHTMRTLDKIDARIEKIDSRVGALEAQLVSNSAEFRVQIKGLQEEIAALRSDLRGFRRP